MLTHNSCCPHLYGLPSSMPHSVIPYRSSSRPPEKERERERQRGGARGSGESTVGATCRFGQVSRAQHSTAPRSHSQSSSRAPPTRQLLPALHDGGGARGAAAHRQTELRVWEGAAHTGWSISTPKTALQQLLQQHHGTADHPLSIQAHPPRGGRCVALLLRRHAVPAIQQLGIHGRHAHEDRHRVAGALQQLPHLPGIKPRQHLGARACRRARRGSVRVYVEGVGARNGEAAGSACAAQSVESWWDTPDRSAHSSAFTMPCTWCSGRACKIRSSGRHLQAAHSVSTIASRLACVCSAPAGAVVRGGSAAAWCRC